MNELTCSFKEPKRISSKVEPSSTFETVAIERSRWMPARIAEDEGATGPFSIELYLKYYRIRNRAAMLPKKAIGFIIIGCTLGLSHIASDDISGLLRQRGIVDVILRSL